MLRLLSVVDITLKICASRDLILLLDYLLEIYDRISCIPYYTHMNVRAAMSEYLELGYKRRSDVCLLRFVKVPKIFK